MSLQKRLENYSLTFGSLLFIGSVEAQITYTDINPDTIITLQGSQFYALDLNNDSQPDFLIQEIISILDGHYPFVISPYPGSPYSAVLGDTIIRTTAIGPTVYPYPDTLNTNDNILPGGNWLVDGLNYGYTNSYFVYDTIRSNWVGAKDNFVGVRFKLSGQFYYGWVRISLNANADTLTIKDYAYNTIQDAGINAGQGLLTSMNAYEVFNPYIHVYDRVLFVNLPESILSGGIIRLFNTNGQLLESISITDMVSRISLKAFTTGIYFVQIEQNSELITRKIYIQ